MGARSVCLVPVSKKFCVSGTVRATVLLGLRLFADTGGGGQVDVLRNVRIPLIAVRFDRPLDMFDMMNSHIA